MPEIQFSSNLKRFRERLGLSKEELANRIGVSDVTIGYWESGRNDPRLSKLEHIAGALGVTVYDLLFGESKF